MESFIHIIIIIIRSKDWSLAGLKTIFAIVENREEQMTDGVYWWISKIEILPLKDLIQKHEERLKPILGAAGVQSLARVSCLPVPRGPRRPCPGLLTMWSTFSGIKDPAGLFSPFFQPSPSDRWHTMQQNSKSLKTKKLVSFIWFQWRQTLGMFAVGAELQPFSIILALILARKKETCLRHCLYCFTEHRSWTPQ